MSLWVNILGSQKNIDAAALRVFSILLKKGYPTKIITMDDIYWDRQIAKEIHMQHKFISHKYAVVAKCGAADFENEEELRKINNYIRYRGVYIKPVCFSTEKDLFDKNRQINQVFDVNKTREEHEKDIKIYLS